MNVQVVSYAFYRVEILIETNSKLAKPTVIPGDSTATVVWLDSERLRGIYRHLAPVSAASSTFYFSHADTINRVLLFAEFLRPYLGVRHGQNVSL